MEPVTDPDALAALSEADPLGLVAVLLFGFWLQVSEADPEAWPLAAVLLWSELELGCVEAPWLLSGVFAFCFAQPRPVARSAIATCRTISA
ncbi:MAG TPA: hypothetical protein VG498_12355 [Terriglobales bacterium]|nr:hypothetical protein [Terriglobales bacterium]